MSEAGWTDGRIELLRTYHGDGLSYSQIAHQINRDTGSNFSRNACIGKAKRIGLADRERKGAPYVGRQARAPRKPRQARKSKPAAKPRERLPDGGLAPDNVLSNIEQTPPPSEFLGVTFLDLKPKQCLYPRGGTNGEPMLFCGQPKIDDSSYCAACHWLCHAGLGRVLSPEERARRTAAARRWQHKARAA